MTIDEKRVSQMISNHEKAQKLHEKNVDKGAERNFSNNNYLIGKIVNRYFDLFKTLNVGYLPEKIDIHISMGYAPLSKGDLERLLDGSDEDLAHDVGGINSHIDRTTKLMDETFVPRCMR